MMEFSRRTALLFWKRLPAIVLYSVAFYFIFFMGEKLFYRFMPAEYFLSYYSVNVPNDKKLEEHREVPFKVCRHAKGNYFVEGTRSYYKLREASQRDSGSFIKSQPVSGTLRDDECSDVTISPESFDHTEGDYYFTTYLTFKVNGNEKQVKYESNTYHISKPSMTNQEILNRIVELEKEIELLKLKFLERTGEQAPDTSGRGNTSSTTNSTSTTTDGTTTTQSTTTTNTPTSRPTAQPAAPTTPATPPPTSILPFKEECTVNLLGICI